MSFQLLPLLGGTFDPIHNGHLRCALEISEWLDEPVRLLPSSQPAHRNTPGASAEQRWELVLRATRGQDCLIADDRELRREGDTFTVDTLTELRAEAPHRALAFIVGADAFAEFHRWRSWERLLELAHFIVVPRPGHPLRVPPPLAAWYQRQRVEDPALLRAEPAGHVIEAAITPLEISATQLRSLLAAGRDPAFLVPESVREWLLANPVYERSARQAAKRGLE